MSIYQVAVMKRAEAGKQDTLLLLKHSSACKLVGWYADFVHFSGTYAVCVHVHRTSCSTWLTPSRAPINALYLPCRVELDWAIKLAPRIGLGRTGPGFG